MSRILLSSGLSSGGLTVILLSPELSCSILISGEIVKGTILPPLGDNSEDKFEVREDRDDRARDGMKVYEEVVPRRETKQVCHAETQTEKYEGKGGCSLMWSEYYLKNNKLLFADNKDVFLSLLDLLLYFILKRHFIKDPWKISCGWIESD